MNESILEDIFRSSHQNTISWNQRSIRPISRRNTLVPLAKRLAIPMITRLASGCYLGQVLFRRRLDGILLTETRHAQRDWLPMHTHQNAYFCLVRRGQFTERYG